MPPSTDQETYFVLLSNGEQDGPYTIQELKEMLRNGIVSEDSEIRSSACGCPLHLDELLHHGQTDTIDDITGLNGLGGFSLWRFFADVFRHHSREELLEIFCCGTPATTPPLQAVSSAWPSPWIFARMLLACILLYLGFDWASSTFQNPNLVPGLMFVGNFAIPLCVAVFFFELNVRREVPFLDVFFSMFYGGLMALIFALALFSVSPDIFAWIAGPIEEPAKLLAVILIAGKRRNGCILTGLLLGAGVGAGFAAFESSGYTYIELVRYISNSTAAEVVGSINPAHGYAIARNASLINPDAVMQIRALITPFGHIVWTAITAGAYWMVLRHRIAEGLRDYHATSIDWAAFADVRFLRIAIIPVVLHLVWNTSWLAEFGLLRFLVLGLIAWTIALRLVRAGLLQIREEKCTRGLPL